MSEPGPGEVVLKMRAVSLNYRDLMISKGTYRKKIDPVVPFSDGCGEVVKVGAGVTRVEVGDRVVPNFFEQWLAGDPTEEELHFHARRAFRWLRTGIRKALCRRGESCAGFLKRHPSGLLAGCSANGVAGAGR